MAKLLLKRDHNLPLQTLRERVRAVEGKLQTKYHANTSWDGEQTIRISGPGVKGKMTMDPSKVVLDIDLGLMLMPLKGRIEEGLSRELDKLVRPEA